MNHLSQPNADVWMDIRGSAYYSGLSIWTLYAAVAAHELRHVRVGGRKQIRTTRRWVDEWLERYTVSPRPDSEPALTGASGR